MEWFLLLWLELATSIELLPCVDLISSPTLFPLLLLQLPEPLMESIVLLMRKGSGNAMTTPHYQELTSMSIYWDLMIIAK